MSEKEYNELNDKIIRGLEIAEDEMLKAKARQDENVIVRSSNGEIRSIPAREFLRC